MSHQVTLDIPETVYARAERQASRHHRLVPEVLSDWLSMSLGDELALDSPAGMRSLPDDVVLQMSNMQPSEERQARISLLLERQKESVISAAERTELARLMDEFDGGLLLKTAALVEAVRRGLRPRLS